MIIWGTQNFAFAAPQPQNLNPWQSNGGLAVAEVVVPSTIVGGGSKLPDQNLPQDVEQQPWKPPQWLLDRLDREEEERIRAEVERRQALLKGKAPSAADEEISAEGLVTPKLWEGAELVSAEVIERLQKRQPVKLPAVVDDEEEAILILLMDL